MDGGSPSNVQRPLRRVPFPPAPCLMPRSAIASATVAYVVFGNPLVCATVGSNSTAVASRAASVAGHTTPTDLQFHTSGRPDAATVSVRPISISGTASGHFTRHLHGYGIADRTDGESGRPPRSESQGIAVPTAGQFARSIEGNANPSCMR